MPNEKVKSWHIEAKLTVKNASDNIHIALELPERTPFFSYLEDHFFPHNFGQYIDYKGMKRHVHFTKQYPSSQEILFFKTVLYQIAPDHYQEKVYQNKLEKKWKDHPLSDKFEREKVKFILEDIHEYLQELSANKHSYVTSLFRFLKSDHKSLKLLKSQVGRMTNPHIIATEILRFAGISARMMNGILLSEGVKNLTFTSWVDVFLENNTLHFSTGRQEIGMPNNILPWYEGYEKPFWLKNGKANITAQFSVKKHFENTLTESVWSGDKMTSYLYDLSIYKLPIETQLMLKMLLLIPLGALFCVFLKQIVGITTYGTFMPVLIGMSFKETGLLWGLALFITITLTGMLFRGGFERMRLLIVPRLTAILTVVVGIIFHLAFILHNLNLSTAGLSLFPLIILTMMIERMSLTWEEKGAKESFILALNSLIVAVVCYLVLDNLWVEYMMMTFPELLLIILGLSLMMGRYTGFRLSEYFRFSRIN